MNGARDAIEAFEFLDNKLDCYWLFQSKMIEESIDILNDLNNNLMSCYQTDDIEYQNRWDDFLLNFPHFDV